MSRQFRFVVNPAAGRGRSERILPELSRCASELDLVHSIHVTNGPGHATELARGFKDPENVIVAVGGDGTVNEVINGLVGSSAAFAVLPAGSGNDFARFFKATGKIADAMQGMKAGRLIKVDAGKATVDDVSGRTTKYFVNSLGLGFDAQVAYESRKIKWLKGVPLYALGLLRTLRTFRPIGFKIRMGDEVLKEKCYLVCVCNADHEGGGFKIAPGADPTDGVFDVYAIKDMPLSRIAWLVPKVLKGSHGKAKEVIFRKVTGIVVESEKPFAVHGDGEILSTEAREVQVEMLHGVLNVLVPGVI